MAGGDGNAKGGVPVVVPESAVGADLVSLDGSQSEVVAGVPAESARTVGVAGTPVAGAIAVGVSADDRGSGSRLVSGSAVAVCKAEITIFVRDGGDDKARNAVRDMLAREVERWAQETPGVEMSAWVWRAWRKETVPDAVKEDQDNVLYRPQSGDVVRGRR